MREIKFRAWDKKSKKMRQITEIVFNTGFYLEKNDNTVKLIWVKGQDIIENKEIQIQREQDYILMQYTGLKDKNGKEIYEGDILKLPVWLEQDDENEKCICIYAEEHQTSEIIGFGLYLKNAYLGKYQDLVPSDEWDEFEVIGNIYNNPELLKEEHK